jgi:hypothetical protein
MKMEKMKTFQTSDLYLASALKLHGFKLLDLRSDGRGKGIFVFTDREDRPQFVKNYFGGELTGSLKGFSNAWSDLKSLVNQVEMEKRDGQKRF